MRVGVGSIPALPCPVPQVAAAQKAIVKGVDKKAVQRNLDAIEDNALMMDDMRQVS